MLLYSVAGRSLAQEAAAAGSAETVEADLGASREGSRTGNITHIPCTLMLDYCICQICTGWVIRLAI